MRRGSGIQAASIDVFPHHSSLMAAKGGSCKSSKNPRPTFSLHNVLIQFRPLHSLEYSIYAINKKTEWDGEETGWREEDKKIQICMLCVRSKEESVSEVERIRKSSQSS